MQEKCRKNIMGVQIGSFELVTINSLYYYENTRSWQSTCYQAVLKSPI